MATNPYTIGLDLLNDAPYGVYAVNLHQTIWFWNPGAERITGHLARDIIGHPCHQVLQNLPEDTDTPVCLDGCPSLKATRENRIPLVHEVRMHCASGERKLVLLTPLIIGANDPRGTVLVHLFHKPGDRPRAERVAQTVQNVLTTRIAQDDATPTGETMRITTRELEVLRLTALGLTPHEIAAELTMSYHTARNHLSNMRRKLDARTKLDLVTIAQSRGLI